MPHSSLIRFPEVFCRAATKSPVIRNVCSKYTVNSNSSNMFIISSSSSSNMFVWCYHHYCYY